MNNCNFSGRLGRDAELRQTSSGKSVSNFALAVDSRRNGEKTKLWVECTIWEKRAEALTQYLTKGTVCSVSGEIGAESYQGKDGKTHVKLRLTVHNITLLGGGQKKEAATETPAAKPAPAQKPAAQTTTPSADFDDLEIPF